jgi:hypothetical protein
VAGAQSTRVFHRHGRYDIVAAAREAVEHRRRLLVIARLAQDFSVQDDDGVGSDHHLAFHAGRLGACQIFRVPSRVATSVGPFLNRRRPGREGEPRGAKEISAPRGGRG